MVNGADDVYVKRKGRIERAPGEDWESTPEPLRQDVRRSMEPPAHRQSRQR
jgi:hypothetical protein